MDLPRINSSRLQRVVMDLEVANTYNDLSELCNAVTKTEWGKEFGLTAEIVRELIYEHDTVTQVVKPVRIEPPSVPSPSQISTDLNGEGREGSGIKTFDEGGKGRKQCPNCQKYVGAPQRACVCGHVFVKGESKPKPVEIKVFEEGGKGRKQCEGCQKYVHICHLVCACGHNKFVKKNPKSDEPKTFDEAGPRRKQCPSCQKYMGYSVATCVCGHEFTKEEKSDEPEIKTFDEAGPKRKQCPSCQKYMGYSVATCVCGHEFTKEEKKADRYFVAEERENKYTPGLTVTTPAGPCPVKLESTDLDAVEEWAAEVRSRFADDDKFLAIRGLRYFVRHFYAMNSPEHATVIHHLNDLFLQEPAS